MCVLGVRLTCIADMLCGSGPSRRLNESANRNMVTGTGADGMRPSIWLDDRSNVLRLGSRVKKSAGSGPLMPLLAADKVLQAGRSRSGMAPLSWLLSRIKDIRRG